MSISITAIVASRLIASATALTDGPAELPRVYVNSSMANTPAPGAKTTVVAGTNLQEVLNRAHCGDTLLLQAGATFTGSYYLPAKACDDKHWIVIRTSAPDYALPPEGTRISPCYAGVASLPGRPSFPCTTARKVMARLMAGNDGPIAILNGASHYRIGPGLEITRPLGTWMYYGLIATNGTVANHIVIDRDWIHGVPRNDTTRGVLLSGVTYAAIVDSYLNDFHCAAQIGKCVDSQAILGGTGGNPQGIWKIHNNFLEAAAENIMLGGAVKNSVTPADIEITNNHLFKPLIWMPGKPGFVGMPNTDSSKCVPTPGYCPFAVKNLFELKNAQRVLFDGNILENAWRGFSQNGNSILVNALNPASGSASSVAVMDVTIRYNRVSHAASGFAFANPKLNGVLPLPMGRFSMHDDVFDDISDAYINGVLGQAYASQFSYCPTSAGCVTPSGISVNHVTMVISMAKKFMVLVGVPVGSPTIEDWTFTNSIVSVNSGLAVLQTGSTGCTDKQPTDLDRLQNCFTPYTFTRNALIGGTGTWPVGNYLPATPATVQFVNYNNGKGGDYTLRSTSPYHDEGTDGKDLGADISAVNAHTKGVE